MVTISKQEIYTINVPKEQYHLIKTQKVRSVPIETNYKLLQIVSHVKGNTPTEAIICKVTHKATYNTHFKKMLTLNYVIK